MTTCLCLPSQSTTMSRRRSRLPPPVSSDRELDEFLKGVITTELYVLVFTDQLRLARYSNSPNSEKQANICISNSRIPREEALS